MSEASEEPKSEELVEQLLSELPSRAVLLLCACIDIEKKL